jgi:hypothetical protein
LRYSDPTGHRQCEDAGDGACLSEKQVTKKWKFERQKRKRRGEFLSELRELRESGAGGPACSGSNQSIMCIQTSESELDIPIDLRLQYTQSNSPSSSFDFDSLISQIEFGIEAMDLLDLVENGIQWGRPAYRQIKYAIPLGGYEYGADGLLQLYDDRNKNLELRQRAIRGVVRAGESFLTDGLSIGMGGLSAAALQASVPIPYVSAGVGYVVGSYSTSAIVDNLFVNNVNPYIFNRFLGGP